MKLFQLCGLPCLFLAFFTPCRADVAIYIAAGDAKTIEAKDGQKVTVYGRVEGSEKSPSGTNFVRFGESAFYLVTFKSDLTEFPDGEPADQYEENRIAVTGTVSLFQGKPQIKLTSPDQIQILTDEEVFPPKVVAPPASQPEKSDPPSDPKPEKPMEETKTEKPKPPVDSSLYFKK